MAQPRRGWRIVIPTLAMMLVTTLLAAPVQAGREAKMYAVTTWDSDCSGGTRSSWDNMVDAWYDEISDSGYEVAGSCLWGHCDDYFPKDGSLVNGNVINSKFADASVVAWGADSSYLDDADAAMVAWHGSDASGNYKGSMRVNEAGDGNCKIARSEMALGDTDMEFLHISSCNSMDDNQWSSWLGAYDGLHQIDAFHGNMWISSGRTGDYQDFADDAFDEDMSDAWVDNMYDGSVYNDGSYYDQCPVAHAAGSSESDVLSRLNSERYNNISSTDPANDWWATLFIEGCNPKGESTIENDYSS